MNGKAFFLATVSLLAVLLAVATTTDWFESSTRLVGPEVEVPTGLSQEGEPSELDTASSNPISSRSPLPAETNESNATEAAASGAAQAPMDEPERRLVIRDVEGRELDQENGELVLTGQDGVEVRVAFREGRFSLKGFPEGLARIGPAKAGTDDEPRLVAFENESFEFRRDQPTLLEGRYLRDSTLRVLDTRTGDPVSRIGVLAGHAGPEQRHPGPHYPSAFTIRGAASPVRLPQARGLKPYWVTAKGYNWSYVLVDHETGGEQVVTIESGGKLMVEVNGDTEAYGSGGMRADLRVYAHGTQDLVVWSDVGPSQGYDGIAAGRYDVKVELNSTGGKPEILGETEVDVIASATSTATIVLSPLDKPSRSVGLAGEIIVPKKFSSLELRPSQRIQPAEGRGLRQGDAIRIVAPGGPPYRYLDVSDLEVAAMNGRYNTENGDETFRWKAELTEGQYLFVVEPFLHGVLLDVEPSPDANIRIELPELYPVTLTVVDGATGKPIPGAAVRWSREFIDGIPDGWVERDMPPSEEGLTIHLTEGRFSFGASSPNYGDQVMDAYAGSGEKQFTLKLTPCVQRELILKDGDAVIPWARTMSCSFRRVDSEDFQPCEDSGDGTMRACFAGPGLYEIRLGDLSGKHDDDRVVVDIRTGDSSPAVVQLDR